MTLEFNTVDCVRKCWSLWFCSIVHSLNTQRVNTVSSCKWIHQKETPLPLNNTGCFSWLQCAFECVPNDHTVDRSVVSDGFMDGFVVFKLPALRGGFRSSTQPHMLEQNTNWTFCVANNAHTTVCCQRKWRDMGYYSGNTRAKQMYIWRISTTGSLENKTQQLLMISSWDSYRKVTF